MITIYKFALPIAAVAIIAAGGFYYLQQPGRVYRAGTKIIEAESHAFGSLLAQDGKGVAAEEGAPAADEATTPRVAMGLGGGGGGGGAAGLIYPGPANYQYVYAGDELSLADATVSVLRRVTGAQAASAISEYLSSLDFGVFNARSFSATQVQNLSFAEDRDFGYAVNISFVDGSVSINENWNTWEHPGEECRDQACFDKYRLSESDIPADAELISIANAFLAEHGISADGYAEPYVDKTWREYYDRGEATELYIPDSLQVKYPLVVNNETVYDQGGDPAGLMVNINIRFKRTSGLWGLASQEYESSAYAAEADPKKIIQIAEAGGLYGYLLPARDALEIKLGTPERILMRQYNYQNGASQELLVPALSFPVMEAPDEVPSYQRRPIIIPLASELLVRDGGPVIYEARGGDAEPAEVPSLAPVEEVKVEEVNE